MSLTDECMGNLLKCNGDPMFTSIESIKELNLNIPD